MPCVFYALNAYSYSLYFLNCIKCPFIFLCLYFRSGSIVALALPADSKLQIARDYFLFSYYMQGGMNFRDMATLKWKQIVKGRVVYTRLKTGRMMQFKLPVPAMEILDRYRKHASVQADDFVFPILNKSEHTTPQQISNRINRVLRQMNATLKELAEAAKVPVHLDDLCRASYVCGGLKAKCHLDWGIKRPLCFVSYYLLKKLPICSHCLMPS